MAGKITDDIVVFFQKHRILFTAFFILSLALLIRLSYLETTVVDHPIRADAKKYASYAINLLERGIYSQEYSPNPTPDNQVTPGYPLFLAVIFKLSPDFNTAYTRVLFVQAILGAATAVLTFFVGRFILSYWLATLSGLLTALSPHLISMGGYVLTETLFSFLLMLSLWILLEAIKRKDTKYFFVSTVIMGSACLVRPSLLLFPFIVVPLVLWYWRPENRKKISLAIVLGVILVWSPWSIWSKAGVPKESDKVGLALSSFVFGSYPGMIYKDPRFKGFPYREDSEYLKMCADVKVALEILGKRFKEDPLSYLKWYAIGKPMMFWSWSILVGQGDIYVYPIKKSLYTKSKIMNVTRVVMKFFHPFLAFLTLAGFVFYIRELFPGKEYEERKLMLSVIYLLLLYFTFVHTILGPLPRYSIPLRPVLYIGFSLFVTYFVRWFRRQDRLSYISDWIKTVTPKK